jgi:transcriptional regulator with XRE-family HTH domain
MVENNVSDSALGKNIKGYRERRGLMLRDLAAKLGISASLLSQIENGKTSPSVSTLKRISDELGTSIGALFGEVASTDYEPLMKKKNIKFHRHVARGVGLYFLSNLGDFKVMEPLVLQFKGFASTGNEAFKHSGQEFVTVLKGSIEVDLDGKTYILKKGDCIYFDATMQHKFKNRSKGISESLHVTTPPQFS